MKHFWVFEVLLDLRAYARVNHLPRLAAKVEEALVTAHMEIDPADPEPDPSLS